MLLGGGRKVGLQADRGRKSPRTPHRLSYDCGEKTQRSMIVILDQDHRNRRDCLGFVLAGRRWSVRRQLRKLSTPRSSTITIIMLFDVPGVTAVPCLRLGVLRVSVRQGGAGPLMTSIERIANRRCCVSSVLAPMVGLPISTFERRRSRAMPMLSMKTKKPRKPMLETPAITEDAGRPDQTHRLSQWKHERVRRARSTMFIASVATVSSAACRTLRVFRFGLRGAWSSP